MLAEKLASYRSIVALAATALVCFNAQSARADSILTYDTSISTQGNPSAFSYASSSDEYTDTISTYSTSPNASPGISLTFAAAATTDGNYAFNTYNPNPPGSADLSLPTPYNSFALGILAWNVNLPAAPTNPPTYNVGPLAFKIGITDTDTSDIAYLTGSISATFTNTSSTGTNTYPDGAPSTLTATATIDQSSFVLDGNTYNIYDFLNLQTTTSFSSTAENSSAQMGTSALEIDAIPVAVPIPAAGKMGLVMLGMYGGFSLLRMRLKRVARIV